MTYRTRNIIHFECISHILYNVLCFFFLRIQLGMRIIHSKIDSKMYVKWMIHLKIIFNRFVTFYLIPEIIATDTFWNHILNIYLLNSYTI